MISAVQAYGIVSDFLDKRGMVAIACRELNDSFAFLTNYKNVEDVCPGMPIYQVMKIDGSIEWFDQSFEKDPYEKIDMLIAAPEIDIEKLR